jgi:uncharacterized protein YecE (DUF72 family)
MQKPADTMQIGTPLPVPVHVGTMGWGYTDWSGVFYPAEAASRDYIALYAGVFDAVEIDSTFYGTPRETQVKHWAKVTPTHFLFCPKVPRLITHDMRLVKVGEPLAEFVRVMRLLGPKRGPMLLQMPPDFTRSEIDSLRAFLPTLHDLSDPTARFAIEFRHRSMIGPDVSELLAEHKVSLAATDYAPMPKHFEITADFVYLRLIGRHGAFTQHRETQADRATDLQRWASILRENASHFSAAYVFCNNDYEGYSPATGNRFKALLGLPITERPQAIQGSLF